MGKLHLAAERGNIEECQKLLTEVVRSMKDPLGHKRNIDKIDDIGRTALHYACRNGHYEVGKFLLDNGAMPSTKTFTTGATPLHLAAKHGYGRICKLLLERGASKNERDIDGRTALDIATQAEKQDSIDALQ
ncbi:hypothetical protein A3770_05p39390 [Chloropicon primus]|uniref:Uncharacterized protein n=1 Tax=Chloropicon primus TaxID=1764295 RepID=A0A5B8MMC7_9CHLO|nr:hypothetical protein A3770_05p39390 [Chloropicon primus]|eukprot:QDZ21421.1 hypothetical protein A3770_05p39390 [Chloropicon primus]